MDVKPYDETIRGLLLSKFYSIPRFQRPYSWDRGNVEELWDDVTSTSKLGYFIGSMVFFGGDNTEKLSVVDGQQRLTTITIFLAALRDVLSAEGESDLANGIQRFIERRDENDKKQYVLKTNTSSSYFRDRIQRHGAAELPDEKDPQDDGLRSAYEFIVARLATEVKKVREKSASVSKAKKEVKDYLAGVRDQLLGLAMIAVRLKTEDEAYIVFETLNTRGKDLEQKDLIKNHLLRNLAADNEDLDDASIRWNAMIDSIAKSDANISPSTYIHHFWLSRYEYTPERSLFQSFKKSVKGESKEQARERCNDLLNSLIDDVDTYLRISSPKSHSWKNEERHLKKSLEALRIFRVRQSTPLVLSLLRAYFAGKAKLKSVRRVLHMIEKYHYAGTAIAGLSSSGGVTKMYASAARQITECKEPNEVGKALSGIYDKLYERMPSEDIFSAGFSDLWFTKKANRDKQLVRYALETTGGTGVVKGISGEWTPTIEHIAPESPAGANPSKSVGNIGNLILVDEALNEKLKNKKFEEKKKILQEAGCKLEGTLKDAEKWTDDEVAQRTEELAALSYQYAMKK